MSVPAPGTTNFKVPGPWKSGTVKPFKRGNTETVEALRKRIEDAIAEAEVCCLCACPCLCPTATLDSAHCRLQDADAAPDAQREALSAGLTPASYTSPSASPASQRSVRQHGQSGKPSPESAAQMPPPPRPKRQQRAGAESASAKGQPRTPVPRGVTVADFMPAASHKPRATSGAHTAAHSRAHSERAQMRAGEASRRSSALQSPACMDMNDFPYLSGEGIAGPAGAASLEAQAWPVRTSCTPGKDADGAECTPTRPSLMASASAAAEALHSSPLTAPRKSAPTETRETRATAAEV